MEGGGNGKDGGWDGGWDGVGKEQRWKWDGNGMGGAMGAQCSGRALIPSLPSHQRGALRPPHTQPHTRPHSAVGWIRQRWVSQRANTAALQSTARARPDPQTQPHSMGMA